ncbi:hypothetical protein HJG60_009409 [Phyllostomus discolor]|uniref:Uncharacterized protein n=1 Tax=Phyllostomus discolor TaxID=89673 RepID=A0A833YJP2_9CHIR|nr:hypothetical protein HJG60_009409 [Phyllostomus discolor]
MFSLFLVYLCIQVCVYICAMSLLAAFQGLSQSSSKAPTLATGLLPNLAFCRPNGVSPAVLRGHQLSRRGLLAPQTQRLWSKGLCLAAACTCQARPARVRRCSVTLSSSFLGVFREAFLKPTLTMPPMTEQCPRRPLPSRAILSALFLDPSFVPRWRPSTYLQPQMAGSTGDLWGGHPEEAAHRATEPDEAAGRSGGVFTGVWEGKPEAQQVHVSL